MRERYDRWTCELCGRVDLRRADLVGGPPGWTAVHWNPNAAQPADGHAAWRRETWCGNCREKFDKFRSKVDRSPLA
jgi:hypothetical protein